jgi:hypothetical protein
VGDLEKVGDIRIAGGAELVAVALGSYFIGAAHDPGIFGRAVFAEFFEEFFKPGFKLPYSAVALEAQRDIARRRHRQVYARKGQCARGADTLDGLEQKAKKGRREERPFVRKSIY